MRNESRWSPTKFVMRAGRLTASTDTNFVSAASRLNVELLAVELQQLLKSFARGRVLDLGCGSVPLFEVYCGLAKSVTCVDWSSSEHRHAHVDLEANLNEPLALASESFETVLLTDVLEHIAEPHNLLHEVQRVLVSGGALLGSVPFMYRLHEEPHDHFRYTQHGLTRMALRCGFNVEVLKPYGRGTDVLFDVLGKLLQTAHWRFGDRMAEWAQSCGLWVRDTRLADRINERHASMPLGYVFALRRR